MANLRLLLVVLLALTQVIAFTFGFNASYSQPVAEMSVSKLVLDLVLSPSRVDQLPEQTTRDVIFSLNANASLEKALDVTLRLDVWLEHQNIAEIVSPRQFLIKTFPDSTELQIAPLYDLQNGTQGQWNATGRITLKGLFLGRTHLYFSVSDVSAPQIKDVLHYGDTGGTGKSRRNVGEEEAEDESDEEDETVAWALNVESMPVSVIRVERILDLVFIACVTTLVVCAKVGMGCKIDLEVIRGVLRRPLAPVIGFCCQFIIMPTLSFGVARLLGFEGGLALGFFMAGCAPGGGSSNMFTFLLGGDVNLSVTMTLLSVLASLAMIPLWLYTLGQQFITEEMQLNIPFQNIIFSLIGLIIPLSVGVLIQFKRPNWAKKIRKCLKPFFCLLIVFLFTAGLYTNLYIFSLFTPWLILGGCLLPYTGFLLAAAVAAACRQPAHRVLTIAIETGIQNTGIPIMLMKYSLPQPDADMSLVSPVVIAMFTPLPLWILVICREVYRRCIKKTPNEEEFTPVQQEEGEKEKVEMAADLVKVPLSQGECDVNQNKEGC